ncbi:MAG: GAF domain-containing protein, partial [Gammaproteobacteria bacterium]
MKTPDFPANEKERLETLRSIDILDTDPEERFDRLTRMARRVFGVSIALVSMVDENRQWFKSKAGLDACETGRDISFCGHAILGNDVFVIENALEDERFADNPLVTGPPNIRFYAGVPLRYLNGSKLGTLCIIDQQP